MQLGFQPGDTADPHYLYKALPYRGFSGTAPSLDNNSLIWNGLMMERAQEFWEVAYLSAAKQHFPSVRASNEIDGRKWSSGYCLPDATHGVMFCWTPPVMRGAVPGGDRNGISTTALYQNYETQDGHRGVEKSLRTFFNVSSYPETPFNIMRFDVLEARSMVVGGMSAASGADPVPAKPRIGMAPYGWQFGRDPHYQESILHMGASGVGGFFYFNPTDPGDTVQMGGAWAELADHVLLDATLTELRAYLGCDGARWIQDLAIRWQDSFMLSGMLQPAEKRAVWRLTCGDSSRRCAAEEGSAVLANVGMYVQDQGLLPCVITFSSARLCPGSAGCPLAQSVSAVGWWVVQDASAVPRVQAVCDDGSVMGWRSSWPVRERRASKSDDVDCPANLPYLFGDSTDGLYCCSVPHKGHPSSLKDGCPSHRYCCLTPGTASGSCQDAAPCGVAPGSNHTHDQSSDPACSVRLGLGSVDWVRCRSNLIGKIFNSSTLPTSRTQPDWTIPIRFDGTSRCRTSSSVGPNAPEDLAVGPCPENNMTKLVWAIDGGNDLVLNATVYYTLSTALTSPGSYPGAAPPAGVGGPSTRSRTLLLFHVGHEEEPIGYSCDSLPEDMACHADWEGMSDFANELGFDAMGFHMPLFGWNAVGPGRHPRFPDGIPIDHGFFLDWERNGTLTMKYFIEPVILAVTHAKEVLGYEEIVLVGLSGGGWTTTVAAAVDARIRLSVPVAGSLPWSMWPPVPSAGGDYEQNASRWVPMYDACDFSCMYVLAALEPHRSSVQLLHSEDPCCFRASGSNDLGPIEPQIIGYNEAVSMHTAGHFETIATVGNIHEVSARGRAIIGSLLGVLDAQTDDSTAVAPPRTSYDTLRGLKPRSAQGTGPYQFTIPVEVIPDRRDQYHPRRPEEWWANVTASTLRQIEASARAHPRLRFNVIVSYPLYHDWTLRPADSRLPVIDEALAALRDHANVVIHHYIMTRKGPPEPCCHCCSSLANISREAELTLDEFPEDSIFFDNGPFPSQVPLYTAL